VHTVRDYENSPFLYNGTFTVLRGMEFWHNNEPDFPGADPRPSKADGFYRTVYGYAVAHDGRTLCKCNACQRFAIRRLTGARLPLIPGAEAQLVAAQATLNASPDFQLFIHRVALTYARHFYKYTYADEQAEIHHADTHPKRLLRIAAFYAAQHTVRAAPIWVRKVLYKMKREEIAKVRKSARMIGDIGTIASLQGFVITALMKYAMAEEPVQYAGGEIQFIMTATPSVINTAFQKLLDPPGRYYYCYFSDDACYAVRTANGVVRYNMDISSCDASHRAPIFNTMKRLYPTFHQHDVDVLIRQCELPMTIVDQNNAHNRILLKPIGPRLYSGSTLTTSINNVANLSIAYCIANNPFLPLAQAAQLSGYLVTAEVCEVEEDIQFLKHSPCQQIDRTYYPLLNLGVIVRTSGCCRGDLPGRGPLKPRARGFQKALLQSLSPAARYTVINQMRANVADAVVTRPIKDKITRDVEKIENPEQTPRYFRDESLFRRYRLDDTEQAEILQYAMLQYGETIANQALAKVLTKDYGLSCGDLTVPIDVEVSE